MNELAIIDSDAFEFIEDVAKLHIQGSSPYSIARALGRKTVEVRNAIEQWQTIIRNDADSRDAARDYLDRMVVHYDRLIEESYKLLKDLKSEPFTHNIAAQMNTTLKNISEYESKRVDFLQKAGLLEGADLGDELAEREEKEAKILNILRNDLCPDCQKTVATKLREVTNVVEVAVTYEE